MSGLTFTDGVPAIDHHSHAGYVRPGQEIEGLDGYEFEISLGHVEAHVPHADYQEFQRLRESGKVTEAQELGNRLGIPQLIAQSLEFQSTTVHAAVLREGVEAMYGRIDPATVGAVTTRARVDDFPGLYDRALRMSDTTSVLTDIPEIDPEQWPHERYKPIARIDPYLYPFGHPEWTSRGTDTPRFRRIFGRVLDRQLDLAGIEMPATLAEYKEFVIGSLVRRVRSGFVGLKIASAYVRPLAFLRTDVATAENAWSTLRGTDRVEAAAHRALSDHLVFHVAEWAAREGIPLQIHTGFGHTEPGLRIATADPLLLEPFIADPALNNLKLILIHGGFPFSSHLSALAHAYGNVHLDFSWMPYLHHHLNIRLLHEWLELLPADRVMYGTDTGAPEVHVAATRRARSTLDHVLGKGVREGLWSLRQADWLAARVLHQNLCDVYGVSV